MPAANPPVLGSTTPGDLYVDLQSRALWLGVDASVDVAEVVKIADIVHTLELINAAEDAAKAYADTQVATKAALSHTHTSSQITDFAAAVENVIGDIPEANWVPGMILMWSGSMAAIGVGSMVGWALCDGSNGTPDLRDRFIIGAGNKAVGSVNPSTIATSSLSGAHTHNIGGTTLGVAHIPAHTHALSGTIATTTGGAHTHVGTTDTQGAHQHNYRRATNIDPDSDSGGVFQKLVDDSNALTDVAGAHTHGVTINSSGEHSHNVTLSGNTSSVGDGTSHTHSIDSAPTHNHTLTQAQLRDALPYFALAFIMKL